MTPIHLACAGGGGGGGGGGSRVLNHAAVVLSLISTLSWAQFPIPLKTLNCETRMRCQCQS